MDDEVIRVVIADDHAVVRSGLRMLLEAQDDMHVVAEAGDVPTALPDQPPAPKPEKR